MTATTQAPVTAPGSTAHTDGAWAVIPVQTRDERPRSFDPADFEVPSGREVNWKHTPVDRIAALFEDAATDDSAVEYEIDAPEGVEVATRRAGESPRGEVFEPEDRAAAIAWTRSDEALYVRVPADGEHSAPIVVRMTGAGADRRANAHIVLEAGVNSRATVLLRHEGSAQFAQNVEVLVRDGAHLEVVTVQQWDDDAAHAASHQ